MTQTEPPIQIHLDSVHFAYEVEPNTSAQGEAAPRPIEALRGISLDIRAGEHVCIVGGNGSGKSTLVQLMNGLLAPTSGTVETLGLDAADPACAIEIRRQAAMVFQHPDDQMVTNIVADDVAFGPENLGLPQPEIARRVDEALAAVGMSEHAKADPANLSGGQKQRVAIAGALAMEPRVLLLDEPSAMLDAQGRHAIQRIIAQLNEQGITIVHVTHFMDDALAAGRVIVLDRGLVALDGTPAEVFGHRELLHSLGLELPFALQLAEDLARHGLEVPLTASPAELVGALAPQLSPAGQVPADPPKPEPAGPQEAPAAIAFDDVSFSYADAASARKKRRKRPAARRKAAQEAPLALVHASFVLPKGQLTALVGHTGSGKSTSVELACALKVPRSGRVSAGGIDTADMARRRELRAQVGYVSQLPERQLFAQTVFEDVAFGPRNLGLPEDEVRGRAVEALAAVGLPTGDDFLGRSPFALSGGQQRSVALAGVIAMHQPILVLDEPMAGLDPQGRARMRELLQDLKSRGTTLMLVTHSMDDVAELADHVIALEHGRVVAEGTPREVFARSAAGQAAATSAAGQAAEVGAMADPAPDGAPARTALGEPAALSFARALAQQGVRLEPAPLTRAELVEEVVACLRA